MNVMIKVRSFVLLAAGTCLLAAPPSTQAASKEPPAADLTAKQILDRMAQAYEKCGSYHDTGVVKTVFFEAGRKRIVEKPFTTAFVRPDRFRFEYKEKKPSNREQRYIVWASGKDVRTWWDVQPGTKKPGSLSLALAGATGVSGGSAHTVPALLLPRDVSGRRLTDLADPKRIEDTKIDKADCYRVQGTYAKTPMTIWIDKAGFLVRRIDTGEHFGKFSTETTTTYDPATNTKVSENALDFGVPGQR